MALLQRGGTWREGWRPSEVMGVGPALTELVASGRRRETLLSAPSENTARRMLPARQEEPARPHCWPPHGGLAVSTAVSGGATRSVCASVLTA